MTVFQFVQLTPVVAAVIALEYVLVLSLSPFEQSGNSCRSNQVVKREDAGRLYNRLIPY